MTFTFIYKGNHYWDEKWEFPFRVGDVVKVNNWGEQYTTFYDAFKYFGAEENRENQVLEPSYKEFKIKGVAKHPNFENIICYIVDRTNKWAVIGPDGLRVVKQYPLRKGETKEIVVKKIPIM